MDNRRYNGRHDLRLYDRRQQKFDEANEVSAIEEFAEDFRLPINHRPTENVDLDNVEQASLDTRLPSSNVGFRLLQKMGWKGKGLGKDEQGIIEPIKSGMRDPKLGIGKQEEDDFFTAEENIQRKKLDIELEETEDIVKKREVVAEREQKIQTEVKEIRKVFFCELCNKQYKLAVEFEGHLSSYDHNHRKRFKEMREMHGTSSRDDRQKREQQRQEREMAKFAQMADAHKQQQQQQQQQENSGTVIASTALNNATALADQDQRKVLKFGFSSKVGTSKEAPIIGRPTILATTSVGENMQWVQCEDCSKWRKIPADALLPSRWTCSKNQWNPERSLCSADEELTSEELDNLFPSSVWAASNGKMAAKLEPDVNENFLEGLDGLADLAIQEDGEAASSPQATTKHPRHKLGCTCIVCIQPPSGMGPKHKPSCMCPVCMSVKRRFNTLMLRREQKHSEKAEKKLLDTQSREQPYDDDVIISAENGDNCSNRKMGSNVGFVEEESNKQQKMSSSLLKSQALDLNIQPEREEELLSSASESIHRMRLVEKVSATYCRKQRISESSVNGNSVSSSQTPMDGIKGPTGISLDSNHQNADIVNER